MKRILYFFLGLAGFLSLLCSVGASVATNEALMKQGFLQFARTGHLGVSPSRYEAYAQSICAYLDGKGDSVQVEDPASGAKTDAFSPKENAHLADVRGVIGALELARYLGGGLVIGCLGLLYLFQKNSKAQMLAQAVGGFALSALFMLAAASALAVWGAVNFDGLFITFHKLAFTNDLWLLDPNTDLLVALMPLPFFTWYAGEMLKSMLPVLGIMAAVIIAWIKTGKKLKETETK